jgi:hypothetical protein
MEEINEELEKSKVFYSTKGEITDACILGYEVKTNGFHGGDAGHGSYLEITFTNEASVAMDVAMPNTAGVYEVASIDSPESVTIKMRGDAEIRTMVIALRRMSEFLEKVLRPTGQRK